MQCQAAYVLLEGIRGQTADGMEWYGMSGSGCFAGISDPARLRVRPCGRTEEASKLRSSMLRLEVEAVGDRRGMAWYGMVWYGKAWYCGLVWYGMVQFSILCLWNGRVQIA